MSKIFIHKYQYTVFFKGLGFLLLLMPGFVGAQFYNGYQMEFGRSRVQFEDFLWTYYRFDRFDTYCFLCKDRRSRKQRFASKSRIVGIRGAGPVAVENRIEQFPPRGCVERYDAVIPRKPAALGYPDIPGGIYCMGGIGF